MPKIIDHLLFILIKYPKAFSNYYFRFQAIQLSYIYLHFLNFITYHCMLLVNKDSALCLQQQPRCICELYLCYFSFHLSIHLFHLIYILNLIINVQFSFYLFRLFFIFHVFVFKFYGKDILKKDEMCATVSEDTSCPAMNFMQLCIVGIVRYSKNHFFILLFLFLIFFIRFHILIFNFIFSYTYCNQMKKSIQLQSALL